MILKAVNLGVRLLWSKLDYSAYNVLSRNSNMRVYNVKELFCPQILVSFLPQGIASKFPLKFKPVISFLRSLKILVDRFSCNFTGTRIALARLFFVKMFVITFCSVFENIIETSYIFQGIKNLTYSSPVLQFKQRQAFWFSRQIKWLVCLLNETLIWNELSDRKLDPWFFVVRHWLKKIL